MKDKAIRELITLARGTREVPDWIKESLERIIKEFEDT